MTGEGRVGGPYLLVMAGTAVGVCALMLRLPLWLGAGLMGAAILCGALVRLLGAGSGALAVRARAIDVLLLTGLGVALVLSGVLMVLW
ncbi:DUF3017 domain-containing protein [Thermopolyspora sp. NPDC052614]|uniref:DUF3017 domain-containing protein n=1 Tax=Thermopolyspora sp. NPDC052614 TaxID=3155682 RepID=UPI003431A2B1